MPDLIHLNGVSGVGKSTVARHLGAAVVVDIDDLRADDSDDAKRAARDEGFALVAELLRAGRDVVLPQLVMRVDVIEHLEALAHDAGARYVEVVLEASPDLVAGRRAGRPARGRGLDDPGPSPDAPTPRRPTTVVVDASGAPQAVAERIRLRSSG